MTLSATGVQNKNVMCKHTREKYLDTYNYIPRACEWCIRTSLRLGISEYASSGRSKTAASPLPPRNRGPGSYDHPINSTVLLRFPFT